MYFLNEFIYLITKAEFYFDTWVKFHHSPRRHIQSVFYRLDNTLRVLNLNKEKYVLVMRIEFSAFVLVALIIQRIILGR